MISDQYKQKVAEGKSHWLERDSDVSKFIGILREKYHNLDGLKVLDVGCAQGRDTAEISNYGIEASGIDVNEDYIREAKKNYPGIKYDVGRIEKLPYQEESFDAIYCVNTLFYSKPEESLPELERVLKTGGIAFITLDEKIVDLDKNEEFHAQNIAEALKQFKCCEIRSKNYGEREDELPFKHKHFFYYIVLQKI